MSSDEKTLTTTSYAILGLLAMRPWTTYELAQQMRRSLRYFWPRATSQIYVEPKRLVAEGLARATTEFTGKRARTVYAITPKGRRRLARWLGDEPAAPVLEAEALLKLWMAEHGTKENALDAVAALQAWADERAEENVAFAREYLADGGPFPARLPQIIVTGRFMADFAEMVRNWAAWAEEIVAAWPEDPSKAAPDLGALEAIVRAHAPCAPSD